MRPKSVTPRFQIQRKTWRAWKRGMAERLEERFELGQLESAEVDGSESALDSGVDPPVP